MYSNILLFLLIHQCIVTSSFGNFINNVTDDIYRLSDNIIPLYYELKTAPDLQNLRFSGTVNITILVNISTEVVKLHSKQLTIEDCKVTRGYYKLSSKFHLEPENDLLVIEFPRKLPPNQRFVISVDFKSTLNKGWTGFMNSSYTINGIEKRLAYTHFEPIHAREAFPCFDEPRFRTQFIIHLARYTHEVAISNMPLRVTTKDISTENRVWDEFNSTPPMPTYLVAFMVSELTHLSNSEKTITIWARENAIEEANYALSQSHRCLRQMENMTGIAYMLPKLDIVAVPNARSNAMEHWGMLTFREGQLLSNKYDSIDTKIPQVQVQCHEIAHQWFGNLVTLAWWDYTWIKEGFADYYEYFATAMLEPSWRLDELFITQVVHKALWIDIKIDRSMTKPIKRHSQLVNAFDPITHKKGAAVIRMLEHIISTESFYKFVHNFLIQGRDKYNGVVNQDNLFDVLENQVRTDHTSLPPNISISQIMRTWTKNTGYPLISVTRNLITKTAKLEQTTYKTSRAPKSQPDQHWIVPITYTTSSNPSYSVFKPSLWSFAEKAVMIPHKIPNTDWILCNLQRSGYYRVNYDLHNWKLLISQLMQDHTKIHPLSRAQLLDDAFVLAYDGKLSYWIPLQLALYLTKETDMIPWSSVLYHLICVFETFAQKIIKSLFAHYVQLIISNQYQKMELEGRYNNNELIRQIRPQFLQLACIVGLHECIRQAMDEYKNNENNLNSIPEDLKLLVFQTALRHARNPSNVENKLLSLYEETKNAMDQKIILLAAGSTGNQRLLNEILSKTDLREVVEILDNLSHFDTMLSTNILTACLEQIHNKISTSTELGENDVSLLKLLFARTQIGIQNEKQLNLLMSLKSKLVKYKHKYANIIEFIENTYITGKKTADQINKKMDKMKSILIDLIVTFTDNVFFSPN